MKILFSITLIAALGALSCGDACKRDRDDANEAVEKVRAQHLSCLTANDCTSVSTATACGGNCPVVVNLDGVAAVTKAVKDANDEYCSHRAGCPMMMVDCIVAEPDCVANVCINAALP